MLMIDSSENAEEALEGASFLKFNHRLWEKSHRSEVQTMDKEKYPKISWTDKSNKEKLLRALLMEGFISEEIFDKACNNFNC